jgi:hypothetical protein
MKIELLSKISPSRYSPNDFPDNIVGIIVEWDDHKKYINRIVIKKGDTLFSLSDLIKGTTLDSWTEVKRLSDIPDLWIEKLPVGSEIKITL